MAINLQCFQRYLRLIVKNACVRQIVYRPWKGNHYIFPLSANQTQRVQQFSISKNEYSSEYLGSCYNNENDPAVLFFDNEVQAILKKLTGFNLDKIFTNNKVEEDQEKEDYKFVTVEEMNQLQEKMHEEAKKLLQMPPVVKEREPIDEILSQDFALEGYIKHPIVFTDVSPGIADKDRIIITRETDGTLQHASWDQRQRMNQIFNPSKERRLISPPIFDDQNLQNCLQRSEFNFLLDFACLQFEPDDPKYHRVTAQVYNFINERSLFDTLESTRHFGPLCFYLAWNRKIDNLVGFYILHERISDAVLIIQLYKCFHSQESLSTSIPEEKSVDYVQNYIENVTTPSRSSLMITLQTYKEMVDQRNRNQTIERSN